MTRKLIVTVRGFTRPAYERFTDILTFELVPPKAVTWYYKDGYVMEINKVSTYFPPRSFTVEAGSAETVDIDKLSDRWLAAHYGNTVTDITKIRSA